MDRQHILISLEPRHAQSMLSGNKSIELRRRAIGVEPGSIIWIYSKRPCGEVVAFVEVVAIHSAPLQSIWRRYGARAAITREEFFEYFSSRAVAHAIEVHNVKRLKNPVTLERLRMVEDDFRPPQFFKRLYQGGKCFDELLTAAMGDKQSGKVANPYSSCFA